VAYPADYITVRVQVPWRSLSPLDFSLTLQRHPQDVGSIQVYKMRFSRAVAAASLASVAIAAPASPTATDKIDVLAAQATARTESPTSHVKGKVFDRYVSIWFENTDYDMAAADRKYAFQGIGTEAAKQML